MKQQKIIIPVMIVLVCMTLIGVYHYQNQTPQMNKDALADMLDRYQHTYVGDNAAIGGILYDLPLGDQVDSFELGTQNEPYSITINYKASVLEIDTFSYDMTYVTTALFALVQNVDVVIINVPDLEPNQVHRTEIQSTYDHDLAYYAEDLDIWQETIVSKIYDIN